MIPNWQIIDAHEQKFQLSCIPSCVEMIMKLEGAVPPNYYVEQSKWGNNNGGFCSYSSSTLHGLHFCHEFTMKRGSNFPLTDLFRRISDETAAGRYVAISLESGVNHHMWVVYKDTGTEFLAFSKADKVTIKNSDVRAIVTQMQGTDILTYSK